MAEPRSRHDPDHDPEPPSEPGRSETDFLRRVMCYLDDALTPEEAAELRRELSSDPGRREAFVRICFSESLSREAMASAAESADAEFDGVGDEVGAEVTSGLGLSDTMVLPAVQSGPDPEQLESPPPASAPKPPARRLRPLRRWGAAAAVLVVSGGLYLVVHRLFTSAKAARLGSVATASWGGPRAPRLDEWVRAGSPLDLKAGCADLKFGDGADVIVEGPARLTVDSPGALSLSAGKVVVRMPHGGKGFEVRTPSGTITDLGTEFGVAVPPGPGAQTEVNVFQGSVRVEPATAPGGKSAPGPSVVRAGDAARVGGGTVTVSVGGASPQRFVRQLLAAGPLDVVDLLNGGDGTTGLRGNQIDAASGAAGPLAPTLETRGDGRYHPVPTLPVVDGCFMPDGTAGPVRVDSAGHTFDFPPTNGITYVHIVAGGHIPVPGGFPEIGTSLNGIDYSAPGRGLLLVHPNAGLTLDLDAVRRLHPGVRLTRFHCILGNSHPVEKNAKTDAYLLADGQLRFEKRRFTAADGAFDVDFPVRDSDRFLTIATTDGGDGTGGDDVLLGDPALGLAPAP